MEDNSPPKTPGAQTSPVISYHGPAPFAVARDVSFVRQGEVLTITVPPASLARQIVFRSILFLICTLTATALAWALYADLRVVGFRGEPGGISFGGAIVALLVWGAIAGIRRIIYIAREGRLPSVIRVWPGGIEIQAPGKTRSVSLRMPRDQIAHVQIHPQGMGRRLSLEIIAKDDTLRSIPIPWPRGYPMIVLEDNLRDVLGLASTDVQ